MSQEEKDQDFINKRKFSRIKLMDPIRLLTSQHSFEEYMGNISKTGCMILGLKEVPLGEKVKVAIKTPEHGYMDFECVVRRCIEKELEDIEDENKEIKDLLFVDDDQDIRALTATFLEEAFQADQFVIAANSEEAKEYLNQYFFRLALTDARMPKEDGAHLLEYIAKTQPECRRAMITGQANHELMQRAINKGNVEHVFYKPIDIPVLKSSLKELLEKTSIYETAKTTRQRYYNCYRCQYSAFRLDMQDGVRWQTQSEDDYQQMFSYFYKKELLKDNICPKCQENSFMSFTSKVYEVGLEFCNLNKDLDSALDQVIKTSLAQNSTSDKRASSRVDGNYVPIKMEKRFETGAELFDAYVSDISRGGVRLESEEDYSIGERISLDLGIVGSETAEIPAKIMHKTKGSKTNSYGLKFEYFDVDAQAKLNHFIDGLALGEYQEREDKKQKKQLAVGIGGAGFSGYFAGLATAIIFFGGFYFFSGYQISKKEKLVTIVENGKSYNLNLNKVFKGETKGLPKKLISKLKIVNKKCAKNGKVNKDCFLKETTSFVEVVKIKRPNLDQLEQTILAKKSKISSSDLKKYYRRLDKEKLSEQDHRIKVDDFKRKVKRAIQLPDKN